MQERMVVTDLEHDYWKEVNGAGLGISDSDDMKIK